MLKFGNGNRCFSPSIFLSSEATFEVLECCNILLISNADSAAKDFYHNKNKYKQNKTTNRDKNKDIGKLGSELTRLHLLCIYCSERVIQVYCFEENTYSLSKVSTFVRTLCVCSVHSVEYFEKISSFDVGNHFYCLQVIDF